MDSIGLRSTTKQILTNLKLHPKEPYNDVIIRLVTEHKKYHKIIDNVV